MASQSRLLKFFASPTGRKVMFFASCTASVSAFALNYFPHTFLTKQHREFVALYKEGMQRPLTDTLLKRYEVAVETVAASDFERGLMEPFMVTGFDTYHVGSTKYRYGAYTGIPINYTYTSVEDINKSDIIIRGQPVDWNSKGGKLLEEALVLTPDEQLFGITREIIMMKDSKVLMQSLYAAMCLGAYYTTTTIVNSKMFLFYKPLSLRIIGYTIIGGFMLGVYTFLTDFSQVKLEGETDEKLAKLGKPFLEAGIRFYDKLLKKNIAIRELTGDSSEFSITGNENFYLRHKHLPITLRKGFFEAKLKDLNKKVETLGENPEV